MAGGEATNGAGRLLEREAALAAVGGLVARARSGSGGLVVVEGAAGLGKSRLLAEAVLRAEGDGVGVLRARGEELDRAVPWGLVRRLLGGAVAQAQAAGVPLLAGAAAAATPIFDRSAPVLAGPPGDAVLSVAHALLWVVASLAETGPLALCVDDAHWVDAGSLQMLGYLLGRLEDLPVAVVLARRPREPGSDLNTLEVIAADARVEHVTLEPLSGEAIEVLVADALGAQVAGGLSDACATMTRGNPFYLHELLLELAKLPPQSLAAETVSRLAPESVSRAVFVRLGRLSGDCMAFARAVAVLGDDALLSHAAELAGLDLETSARAFDALAKEEILDGREPLGFVHPLVAQAIHSDIGAGERGDLHRAAAGLLDRDGAEPEAVAVHLVQAGCRGDRWVVSALRAAAARALAQGAREAAADWLARALAEPVPAEQRSALLAELGRAEAALGRPEAVERLQTAAELVGGGEAQARICADLGRALALQGQLDAAVAAFERGLECLQEPVSELRKELRAAWWSAASLLASMRAEAMRAPVPTLPPAGEQPTPGERELLAQLAMQRAFEGRERAEVVALAERAWDGGQLLETASGDGMTWSLVTGALMVADESERGIEVCDAALADARDRGSPMAFANACYCRAWPLFTQGRINDSLADAQTALDARHDGWSAFLGTGAAILVLGLIERGDPEAAREALAIVEEDTVLRASTQYPMILVARGRLLVAEGRPAEALTVLLSAGEMLTAAGMDCPSAVPWHADAALAAGLAGEREQARQLADGALAAARRGGAPTAIARALRAAARAERGERAIELHREALATLDGLPPRLERAHVLVDLGAALRRSRRRAAARELLRRGLAQASDGGALALAQTARIELAAAGAHASGEPRDGLASLTPSERRVAEMAASGMSNRAIAQALFVTVKAVEYHLANTYRKLDVSGRGELEPLLASVEDGQRARSTAATEMLRKPG
ncbi:MAG TPA: AAA family ATPase [Solirubrobacteraceae bacterium]|jgi:DNA-binding CsgD family transcriptional regulator